MTSTLENLNPHRAFAVDVVQRLHAAGFHALWAGGCVRDQLLGMTPKDFDVASTATPDEVIQLFGKRRTIPVGASFGVVIVLGPTKAAGQIEVATFRTDGTYLDGRRPTSVTFGRPEEDARRRDFTINGMFYDPIADQVIDYVGGREDLAAHVIRAIGDPVARFTEDKLRLLRAVRFAATLGFELEDQTAAAVRDLHHTLPQVSVERIAQELRRMLAHPTRADALRMLLATGLLGSIFLDLSSLSFDSPVATELLSTIAALRVERFEPSLASIALAIAEVAHDGVPAELARRICRDLRLSNDETDCVGWIVQHLPTLAGIRDRPLHILKPLLADDRHVLLLDLARALAASREQEPVDAAFCDDYLSRTLPERLNPRPLIDGRDVAAAGIAPGPRVGTLLHRLRCEQLDERLTSREAALDRLRQLAASSHSSASD